MRNCAFYGFKSQINMKPEANGKFIMFFKDKNVVIDNQGNNLNQKNSQQF